MQTQMKSWMELVESQLDRISRHANICRQLSIISNTLSTESNAGMGKLGPGGLVSWSHGMQISVHDRLLLMLCAMECWLVSLWVFGGASVILSCTCTTLSSFFSDYNAGHTLDQKHSSTSMMTKGFALRRSRNLNTGREVSGFWQTDFDMDFFSE